MNWARCFAFTLASVCFSTPAIGQNSTSPSTAENNESKPIEQITVIGKKPFLTLFNQLEAAKIDLYTQYNEYNNLEKYNVVLVPHGASTEQSRRSSLLFK